VLFLLGIVRTLFPATFRIPRRPFFPLLLLAVETFFFGLIFWCIAGDFPPPSFSLQVQRRLLRPAFVFLENILSGRSPGRLALRRKRSVILHISVDTPTLILTMLLRRRDLWLPGPPPLASRAPLTDSSRPFFSGFAHFPSMPLCPRDVVSVARWRLDRRHWPIPPPTISPSLGLNTLSADPRFRWHLLPFSHLGETALLSPWFRSK